MGIGWRRAGKRYYETAGQAHDALPAAVNPAGVHTVLPHAGSAFDADVAVVDFHHVISVALFLIG